MFNFGIGELSIILLILLLLFGASRLPGVARALGGSLKEFKKGVKDIKDDVEEISKD